MNKSESKYFNTARKMNLALIALLKTKSFDYITVSELCRQAGVNRSTFYLHYETVGDLLEETTRYLLDDFLTRFEQERAEFSIESAYEKNGLIFICDSYLIPYLNYVKENAEIFSTALKNEVPLGTKVIYRRLFENIFDPVLAKYRYPEEEREYVMLYYLNGIYAVCAEWIRQGCQKPAADISHIIQECVFGRSHD